MDDHMKRGWLEPVPDDDILGPSYYMPHHGVLKESSTTKLRVVYNASAKSSSGRSLNDILMIGPTVQPTLATILLRFCRYPYAITSDISKMYLQLAMDPVHSNYQRLIWRDSRDGPVRDYRITRVCFGVASSPFLATRAFIQLADENEAEFPRAAEALRTSFYVDDCISSAPTLNAASETQTQLIEVLKRGGFELAKWSSNNPSLLSTPLNSQETSSVFIGETTSSALGLSWDSSADVFQFKSPVVPSDDLNTKRKMASTIAKLFDPIGLVGPIIVEAKILLQDIHELKLGWDKIVLDGFQEKWRSFVDRLKDINQIRIPRWISTIHSPTKVKIHAFCDASMRAYGTAIYVVTRDDSDGVSANLLPSKSRVAPIAQLTMPRFELCAAVLATETVEKMKDVFQPATIHFWSDSTIVLCWIHRPPVAQGVFVSNRIRNILKLSTIDQWRRVVTNQNPADIISRGMSPQQLTHCDLWWKGPPWLSKSVDDWPPVFHPSGLQPEEPSCLVLTQEWPHHGTLFEHLSAKYSSFPKILRIVVYFLRFTRGARDPQRMSKGPITSVEMELARSFLIGQEQRAQWPGLPNHIHKNSVSSSKWKSLASLTPFIDEDGLIRVGGPIENSDEAFAAKHPILLPKSKLSLMILRHEHLKQLHAGPTLLLASIRQRYWPLSGRNLTRRVVHECYQCFRAKPKPLEQLMGDLPEHRVNFYRPFQATGVDFAGPVQMLSTASRGIRARRAQVQKAYIAIFVCMATKATHLELVTALSTDAFLACFRRFAARRTMPRHMHSDCGKNFEGANNELSRLLREELHQREITTATHDEEIVWNFNPPASPHHGGFWEACVKSTKFHLSRVTQSHPLCYEELSTLLCQIECILNSRPICALSNDPNDPKYLTPGHFLVGVLSNAPPDPNLAQIPANRLSYWQACQSRVQEFGRKWRLHYLNTLQQRTRWKVDQENLTTGIVVLLLDETNREGSKWVLGRIENIHPGADGRVRVVTIRTARGTYRRPITKIAKIPEADDNSSGVSTSRQTGEDVPALI
ncbi:uncharacterized protein LOC129808576 [Phlebotomus papatasi]|uniref:uncharacterized protein LOC129808576 n=1 Tax=Phlebotomus papatasi TaxID=29031 RepID=UPI0024840B73|nr:uncharacterized protein LOC129808576 [Phlebotomus papatasi]